MEKYLNFFFAFKEKFVVKKLYKVLYLTWAKRYFPRTPRLDTVAEAVSNSQICPSTPAVFLFFGFRSVQCSIFLPLPFTSLSSIFLNHYVMKYFFVMRNFPDTDLSLFLSPSLSWHRLQLSMDRWMRKLQIATIHDFYLLSDTVTFLNHLGQS
jgi:hypothetical protein